MSAKDTTPGGRGGRDETQHQQQQQQQSASPDDRPSKAKNGAQNGTSGDVAAGRFDHDGGASFRDGGFDKPFRLPNDNDVAVYNAAAEELVVAQDKHFMAGRLCTALYVRIITAQGRLAIPLKEAQLNHRLEAAQEEQQKAATQAGSTKKAVKALARAKKTKKTASRTSREAEDSLASTLEGFRDRFDQDALAAIEGRRETSASGDAPRVETLPNSDGKRKRRTGDRDVVASKTGKHGGGVSSSTAAATAATASPTVSANGLLDRWRDTIRRQEENVETARDGVEDAVSKLENAQNRKDFCAYWLKHQRQLAAKAKEVAVVKRQLLEEAKAKSMDLQKDREYEEAVEAETAAREVMNAAVGKKNEAGAVFRRACYKLPDYEWRRFLYDNIEIEKVVDDIDRTRREAETERRRSMGKVYTPVVLPERTGLDLLTPAGLVKAVLKQEAKGKAMKKSVAAVEAALGVDGVGVSNGTRGTKRKVEDVQFELDPAVGGGGNDGAAEKVEDGGVASVGVRRSTRRSRLTASKELGKQQKCLRF